MWAYEKKLQYPVRIKNPNPLYAKIIISQLGGPDGELGAALRYLNQRYTMPYGDIIGILTDVGTEAKKAAHRCQSFAKQKNRQRNLSADRRSYHNQFAFLSTRSTKNCCFSFSVKRSYPKTRSFV